MPVSFEEKCRQLLAQPDPENTLVFPRPGPAEIMKSKSGSDLRSEEARLVDRFYDLLASEIRAAGQ